MATLSERNLHPRLARGDQTGRRQSTCTQGSRSHRRSVVSDLSAAKDIETLRSPQEDSNCWRRLSRVHAISMRMRKRGGAADLQFDNDAEWKEGAGTAFKAGAVTAILETVLERYLTDVEYAPETVSTLTQHVVDEVKNRVKELQMQRYKVVCQVYLGSRNSQSMELVSRAVWNKDTDNFATASFQNQSLFAVACAHAVYFE